MSPVICSSSHLSTTPITNDLQATHFIRKMRGGSQSCLIRASDQTLYVVKFHGNPQGPFVLGNEAAGSALMRAAGLPVPSSCQILVTKEFLEANPGVYPELADGRGKIEPGIHFASRYLIDDHEDELLVDYLPDGCLKRISNTRDFLGVYIFDIATNHCDTRQPVFRLNPRTRSFKAYFIDNGHLFGGAKRLSLRRPSEALCSNIKYYSSSWGEPHIDFWIDRISTALWGSLKQEPVLGPSHWYHDAVTDVSSILAARLEQLPELVWNDINRDNRMRKAVWMIGRPLALPLRRSRIFRDGSIAVGAPPGASC